MVKVIDGERAKMGLMGVTGGWRGCGEEGKGGAAGLNGFEIDERRPRPVERDGGGWARLCAAIGAA